MTELQFLQYPSTPEPVSGAIVFLHGLGAGADDFSDLPRLLDLSPAVKYIFPQAPDIPITINGGIPMPAWYDIKTMSVEREFDHDTVSHSVTLIEHLLDKVVSEGIPADQIVIGGFSQGGAMALEMGMNYSQTIAGVISLSAYCLNPEKVKAGSYAHRRSLPLLCCHGKQDQMIPFELGDRHRRLFQENGFQLEWYQEEELGHNLSGGEVMAMKKWLERFPFLSE